MKIAVVGAGGWGTALAIHLARLGHRVHLWVHGEETWEVLNRYRENVLYLPGISLPDAVRCIRDPAEVLTDAEGIVLCIPSRWFRETLRTFQSSWERLRKRPWVVSATKGLEMETQATMSEITVQEWPAADVAVLSGPSFAREVAEGRFTAVVLAHSDEVRAEALRRVFHGRNLRVFRHTDPRGVELGGALKNVMALAVGMAYGMQLGHNTVAFLLTQGAAEMMRLGVAMGARPETLRGLAGWGDLVLTCTGPLSRNRMVGYRLGLGEPLEQILTGFRMAVEGIPTTQALKAWADRRGIDASITQAVYAVLYEKRPVTTVLRTLLERLLAIGQIGIQ